jgi:hypothetical protein
MQAGPLHAPATRRALAPSRSALRAERQRNGCIEIRGASTLRVQTPLEPRRVIVAFARTRPPLQLQEPRSKSLTVVLCKTMRVNPRSLPLFFSSAVLHRSEAGHFNSLTQPNSFTDYTHNKFFFSFLPCNPGMSESLLPLLLL